MKWCPTKCWLDCCWTTSVLISMSTYVRYNFLEFLEMKPSSAATVGIVFDRLYNINDISVDGSSSAAFECRFRI